MSEYISMPLLAAALCADAFAAAFVYGAGRVKIPLSSASVLTLLSAGILGVFLAAGNVLRPFFTPLVSRIVCGGLLTVMGAGKLLSPSSDETAKRANIREPEILSPKEALSLGVSLSLDSAAAGCGIGISGGSLPALFSLSLIMGFLAILAGSRLGRAAASRFSFDFSRLGGLALIVLGLLKFL